MSTGRPESGKRLASGFWGAWLTFFLIWLAATASLEITRIITGLVVAGGIAILATKLTNFWAGFGISSRRLVSGLRYLAVFLREMIKSNIAVMGYVYSPSARISPEVIQLSTRLVGPRERLALTNTLTLTPGSLVIDLDGEQIELHILDRDLAEGMEGSVREFEALLEQAIG